MLTLNLLHRETYTGDEGFYGVTALNMLESPGYLLRPSYYPDGNFLTDKDGFAHPPFNSYFYAISLWFSHHSLAGPEFVNALAYALLLFFVYRFVSLLDSQAAPIAVLLLAASPAILVSYSQLEAEPLMDTFGIAALYFILRSGLTAKRTLFIAGLCIGFSFALKLWLCGPLALAIAASLVFQSRTSAIPLSRKIQNLGLFALATLLPAALHLLVIASFYPQDLSFWLKNIYFGVFTHSGISGDKLGGAGVPSDWIHPVWYYAAALYRDHFFLVPLILLGVGAALSDKKISRHLLLVTLVGAAGVLPLSLLKVKEPLYVLSCAIFLYVLAAICVAALTRRIAAGAELDCLAVRFGLIATFGLLLLFPMAYARGIQPTKITGLFVLVHSAVFGAILAVFLWSWRAQARSLLEQSVLALCSVAIVLSFAYSWTTQKPRDKAIARLIQPYVQNTSPTALSMIASNFKCFQFYSFRRGCYWHELDPAQGPDALLGSPEFSRVRAFILEPEDLEKPAVAPWLRWLENHAVEKTAELNRTLQSVSGYRVFVRNS